MHSCIRLRDRDSWLIAQYMYIMYEGIFLVGNAVHFLFSLWNYIRVVVLLC